MTKHNLLEFGFILLVILIFKFTFRHYLLKDVLNSEINHREVRLLTTESATYFITVSQ